MKQYVGCVWRNDELGARAAADLWTSLLVPVFSLASETPPSQLSPYLDFSFPALVLPPLLLPTH